MEKPKLSSCEPHVLLPALAGRCGNPGDTVFLCRDGCCGDKRRGSVRVEVTKEVVTSAGLLLNWRAAAFWLDTGTVTGIEKVGCGTVDWWRDRKRAEFRACSTPHDTRVNTFIETDRWSVSDQQKCKRACRWYPHNQPITAKRVVSIWDI